MEERRTGDRKEMNLVVRRDSRELFAGAALEVFRLANESIVARKRFSIVLSGGSTPQGLYREMAKASIRWDKWHFFFGDERNVPPDDEQSNLKMANEALLGSIPAEDRNVFAWGAGTGEPDVVAKNYEERIEAFFTANGEPETAFPRFDLVLLGIGKDGHTASLFPGSAALDSSRITEAAFITQLNAWRYTLTLPVINNARKVMILVSGLEKAGILRTLVEGENGDGLPARLVKPDNGQLEWWVDGAAASEITAL